MLVAHPFHNGPHMEVIGVVGRLLLLMGKDGAGLVAGVAAGGGIWQQC